MKEEAKHFDKNADYKTELKTLIRTFLWLTEQFSFLLVTYK